MRDSDFRRIFVRAAIAATIAFTGAAIPRVAAAQTPADTAARSTMPGDVRDNDTDWGWLGLLGLAGLLGLRRRDRTEHVEAPRRP
jgi:MYXO-CTERM domain-containing protein